MKIVSYIKENKFNSFQNPLIASFYSEYNKCYADHFRFQITHKSSFDKCEFATMVYLHFEIKPFLPLISITSSGDRSDNYRIRLPYRHRCF